MNCGAVLLAAGLGTRFDPTGATDKLMMPWQDGAAVLWHSANALLSVTGQVVAVVRPRQTARRELLQRLGMRVVMSAEAEKGMGAALAAGLPALDEVDAVLVCLGDMPALRPATIDAVRRALVCADSIVAPRHQGRRGHPVGFGVDWFNDLRALDGDVGPRHLLERAPVHWIDVDDPGCILDIDRPEDLGISPRPA